MQSFIIVSLLLGLISAQNLLGFLEMGHFSQCEGKDPANYTYITQFTRGSGCNRRDMVTSFISLITCSASGEKTINSLQILARSNNLAGAYYQLEGLYLAQNGNLAGKYLFLKEIGLLPSYLKKCSSVLGYSYISTKSHILLIADKLDLGIFLSPQGAYESFKKTATTFCQGSSIIV